MNNPSWSELDLDIHCETKSDNYSHFAIFAYYFYFRQTGLGTKWNPLYTA